MTKAIATVISCPKCQWHQYVEGEACEQCGYQWFDVEAILEGVRAAGREMATQLSLATDAGIGPAVILPELVTVLRESGVNLGMGDIGKLRELLPF